MSATAIDRDTESSDEEFETQILDIIGRELGAGGLACFLMTFRSGKGDYTAERHQWLDKLTVDDIVRDLEATSDTHSE